MLFLLLNQYIYTPNHLNGKFMKSFNERQWIYYERLVVQQSLIPKELNSITTTNNQLISNEYYIAKIIRSLLIFSFLLDNFDMMYSCWMTWCIAAGLSASQTKTNTLIIFVGMIVAYPSKVPDAWILNWNRHVTSTYDKCKCTPHKNKTGSTKSFRWRILKLSLLSSTSDKVTVFPSPTTTRNTRFIFFDLVVF